MTRQPLFLPMSLQEGEKQGIRQFDIILITGDAYVDHPSFGTALIGRVLWDAGFSVGLLHSRRYNRQRIFRHWQLPVCSLVFRREMSTRWLIITRRTSGGGAGTSIPLEVS